MVAEKVAVDVAGRVHRLAGGDERLPTVAPGGATPLPPLTERRACAPRKRVGKRVRVLCLDANRRSLPSPEAASDLDALAPGGPHGCLGGRGLEGGTPSGEDPPRDSPPG